MQESGISLKRKLALTDCASVLQCLRASNPKCTEKRHLVEVALVKEILERFGIEAGHIAGEYNPTDVFTKLRPAKTAKDLLRASRIDFSKTTVGTNEKYVSREL